MYKISVMNSYGRYENSVIRSMLYENSVIDFCYTKTLINPFCYMCVDHPKWSYLLSVSQ